MTVGYASCHSWSAMPTMPRKLLLSFVPLLLLAGTAGRASADEAPPPVQGITFDEWTSANARLAAGRPLRPSPRPGSAMA